MKALSKTQEYALSKLTNEWQSAYDIQNSLGTLKSLVKLDLAEIKVQTGHLFFPRSCTFFRLKSQKKGT